MEEFPKKNSFDISTYDKWNLKPQISSMFHFDWISDRPMAHVNDKLTEFQVNPIWGNVSK